MDQMRKLDQDFLLAVAPQFDGDEGQAQARITAEIAPSFAAVLAEYGIDTPLRIAHFMAQITHECAHFRTTVEYASGAAYEGRADLGNDQPGDGVRYKGRGLLQLTGRSNYRRYGARMGLPLEDDPDMAAQPLVSLRIACEYWQDHNLNPLCDQDDLEAITHAVNGGLRGLDDRRACLERAKIALEDQNS